jgi:hypothetical protein
MEDHMATDNLARLKELLEKLFQFGSADLDFGIHRIMKRKRAEVYVAMNRPMARRLDHF